MFRFSPPPSKRRPSIITPSTRESRLSEATQVPGCWQRMVNTPPDRSLTANGPYAPGANTRVEQPPSSSADANVAGVTSCGAPHSRISGDPADQAMPSVGDVAVHDCDAITTTARMPATTAGCIGWDPRQGAFLSWWSGKFSRNYVNPDPPTSRPCRRKYHPLLGSRQPICSETPLKRTFLAREW